MSTFDEFVAEAQAEELSRTKAIEDALSKGKLPTNKAVAALIHLINMRTEGQLQDALLMLLISYERAARIARQYRANKARRRQPRPPGGYR